MQIYTSKHSIKMLTYHHQPRYFSHVAIDFRN